jgi:alpha-tubulin suppressor-like RCC1 family protein
MQPRAGSILLSASLVLGGLVSCKDSTDPDLPDPPASFVIMSGNQQDDTVGQELPQPLVARITNASGTAVPGAVVSFVVTSGGGSVFSPAVQANAQGVVQNRWTLGTSTAAAQEVEVRSVNPNTGAPIVFGRFQAIARPDRPASFAKTDGDGQQGTAGAELPNALRVRITDQYGNAVPGITVSWAIASGGGSVSAPTSTTNATGHAVVEWTLGPAAGQGSVTASVAGLSSQSFTAFAAAGIPAHVRIANGNGQRARVATGLPAPLSALVVDANENPVPGVAVSWSVVTGNGTITAVGAATDANGIARADWALGQTAGEQTARASVAGAGSVDFTATADPGNPSAIVVVSGNGQSATVGTTLPAALVVRVVDAHGNVVPNVTVSFAGNGGSLSAASATTSATGEAQTLWTLPTAAGPYTASASVTGLTAAQFTATALAGSPASWAKTSGDGQSGRVGEVLAEELTVRILDQHGNPVPDISVTWTPNGGGAVSPATSVTSSTGHASTRRTLGTTPGAYGTVANSTGLPRLDFSATANPGLVVTLEKVSGDAQSGGLNLPLANPLVVRARDTYGNPVPGQTIHWSVAGGGGSVSPATALTNTEGLANTGWTLGGGTNRVQAINGSLTVTFTATVTGLNRLADHVSAGLFHACAIGDNGRAYCWGTNRYGQLGVGPRDDDVHPVSAVAGDHSFASLEASLSTTCALEGGTPYCWGNLFDFIAGLPRSGTPVGVGQLAFTQITHGHRHACGLTTTGKAYCWGDNDRGQLGTDTTLASEVPLAVVGNLTFVSITGGGRQTCALTVAGQAYCWGNNAYGELGIGTRDEFGERCFVPNGGSYYACRKRPTAVSGGHTFSSISAGAIHTCAIRRGDGALFCWGLNDYGQLGTGPVTVNCSNRFGGQFACEVSPAPLNDGRAYVSVSAGYLHSCAVATNGSGLCWGRNEGGQLGRSTAEQCTDANRIFYACGVTPAVVSGGRTFSVIDAGFQHSCGLTAGREIYCWGDNQYGQLGEGTRTNGGITPQRVRLPE